MSVEDAPERRNNFSDYETFAVQLFDDADRLFTEYGVEQDYVTIDVRSMFFKLTPEHLELVGPLLEYYAIDAPEYVEMRIDGHNPFDANGHEKALLAIRMEYKGADDKEVDCYYCIRINYPEEDRAIVAYKNVDIDKTEKFKVRGIIDESERRGLSAMMNALIKASDREGGRHRRSE